MAASGADRSKADWKLTAQKRTQAQIFSASVGCLLSTGAFEAKPVFAIYPVDPIWRNSTNAEPRAEECTSNCCIRVAIPACSNHPVEPFLEAPRFLERPQRQPQAMNAPAAHRLFCKVVRSPTTGILTGSADRDRDCDRRALATEPTQRKQTPLPRGRRGE